MRVAIDCSPLLMRSGGIKTYLYHLIRNLQSLKGADTVSAFPFLGQVPELDHERSVAGTGGTYARLAALMLANRGLLPVKWIGPRVDIFHMSNQLRKHPGSRRLTATVHDLSSWLFPQFHTANTVRADHEYATQILARADALVAVSHKSKDDAVRILGLPPDRLHVVYHGVSEPYFDVPAETLSKVKASYFLERPYVLFVSTIEPRKNLDRLITAYQGMPQTIREEFELVVAGPAGWNSQQTMAALRGNAFTGVRYLGYVPERDMPGLFAGATVFAYPSLYEGFGLPVLQAMAAGVPVLTSNAGSLPEVAGDIAAYTDPMSVDEIRDNLSRLLTSASERARRGAEGRTHAASFQWSKCAQQTWDIFERIA